MTVIMETATQNAEVLRTLKMHIGMGLEGEKSEDNSIDLQIRIAEIDAEFKKMLDRVSTDTIEAFDEEIATRLMNEKNVCNSSSTAYPTLNNGEKTQNPDSTTSTRYWTA